MYPLMLVGVARLRRNDVMVWSPNFTCKSVCVCVCVFIDGW